MVKHLNIMNKKYSLKTSKIENKPGQWRSTLCEIYQGETKIGEYIRYYDSYSESTFQPFELNGKDYALYSSNYTTISVMTLPDCKPIELKEECVKQMHGFCPVEIYIPMFYDEEYEFHGKTKKYREHLEDSDEEEEYKNVGYSTLGFAIGCIWGDDSSWKLNLIDLSNIENGELWYINNSLKKEWLYEEYGGESLKKTEIYFDNDSPFPSSYYQIIRKYNDFDYNIKKEIETEKN